MSCDTEALRRDISNQEMAIEGILCRRAKIQEQIDAAEQSLTHIRSEHGDYQNSLNAINGKIASISAVGKVHVTDYFFTKAREIVDRNCGSGISAQYESAASQVDQEISRLEEELSAVNAELASAEASVEASKRKLQEAYRNESSS